MSRLQGRATSFCMYVAIVCPKNTRSFKASIVLRARKVDEIDSPDESGWEKRRHYICNGGRYVHHIELTISNFTKHNVNSETKHVHA